MTAHAPVWPLFLYYCHANSGRGKNDALVVLGAWPALMAQCSPADLRPIRVRGKAQERRKAG